MNPEDYQAPEVGEVLRVAAGYFAFLPARLPPEIEYPPALVNALSDADTALGEISGAGRLIPNLHLLIHPYIRREAVLSSRIEGTLTDLPDLWLEDIHFSEKRGGEADLHEVQTICVRCNIGSSDCRNVLTSIPFCPKSSSMPRWGLIE